MTSNHPNCCLCGGKTSPHAGNPNLWPILLSTPDSNGAARPHCTGCVIKRVYSPAPNHKLIAAILEAHREKGNGFDTLASASWDHIVKLANEPDSGTSELVESLEACATTLDRFISITSPTQNHYTQAMEARHKARAALAKWGGT